jgi:hypothetical protein
VEKLGTTCLWLLYVRVEGIILPMAYPYKPYSTTGELSTSASLNDSNSPHHPIMSLTTEDLDINMVRRSHNIHTNNTKQQAFKHNT